MRYINITESRLQEIILEALLENGKQLSLFGDEEVNNNQETVSKSKSKKQSETPKAVKTKKKSKQTETPTNNSSTDLVTTKSENQPMIQTTPEVPKSNNKQKKEVELRKTLDELNITNQIQDIDKANADNLIKLIIQNFNKRKLTPEECVEELRKKESYIKDTLNKYEELVKHNNNNPTIERKFGDISGFSNFRDFSENVFNSFLTSEQKDLVNGVNIKVIQKKLKNDYNTNIIKNIGNNFTMDDILNGDFLSKGSRLESDAYHYKYPSNTPEQRLTQKKNREQIIEKWCNIITNNVCDKWREKNPDNQDITDDKVIQIILDITDPKDNRKNLQEYFTNLGDDKMVTAFYEVSKPYWRALIELKRIGNINRTIPRLIKSVENITPDNKMSYTLCLYLGLHLDKSIGELQHDYPSLMENGVSSPTQMKDDKQDLINMLNKKMNDSSSQFSNVANDVEDYLQNMASAICEPKFKRYIFRVFNTNKEDDKLSKLDYNIITQAIRYVSVYNRRKNGRNTLSLDNNKAVQNYLNKYIGFSHNLDEDVITNEQILKGFFELINEYNSNNKNKGLFTEIIKTFERNLKKVNKTNDGDNFKNHTIQKLENDKINDLKNDLANKFNKPLNEIKKKSNDSDDTTEEISNNSDDDWFGDISSWENDEDDTIHKPLDLYTDFKMDYVTNDINQDYLPEDLFCEWVKQRMSIILKNFKATQIDKTSSRYNGKGSSQTITNQDYMYNYIVQLINNNESESVNVQNTVNQFYQFFDKYFIKNLILRYSNLQNVHPKFYEAYKKYNTSLQDKKISGKKQNQIIKETIQKYLNK